MNGTFMAILSGVTTGIGALSYRYAEKGNVLPIQLNATMGTVGIVLFALLGAGEWRDFSLLACGIGLAGGVSQYAAIRILREAMKRGPLAPAWCAMALGGFVPVIIFSLLFLGEIPTLWQGLSLVCALGAIAAAAANQNGTREGGTTTFAGMAGYAVLLVLLLIFTGVLNVLLKAVADLPGTVAGQSLLRSQGNVLMCFVYVGMAVSSAAELTAFLPRGGLGVVREERH